MVSQYLLGSLQSVGDRVKPFHAGCINTAPHCPIKIVVSPFLQRSALLHRFLHAYQQLLVALYSMDLLALNVALLCCSELFSLAFKC